MGNRWTHIASAISLLALTTASQAASFACQGTLTAVERRICASPVLSGLDEELARAYAGYRRQTPSDANGVREQRRWLAARNACLDEDCLKAAYEQRLAALRKPPVTGADDNTAEAEPEADGPLMMTCQYGEHNGSPWESTHISTSIPLETRASSGTFLSKRFVRTQGKDAQEQTFVIHYGQAAECVYPSGRRVRLKIGTGIARPYGMCGAEPEIFASLWVNERKLDSRIWYAGHCYDGPELSYDIYNGQVTKCLTPLAPETPDNTTARPAESTCIDFPDTARYPVDIIEYPPAHARHRAPGDIVRLQGDSPVCDMASRMKLPLSSDGASLSTYLAPKAKPPIAVNPAYAQSIPNDLQSDDPGVFDFDNDSKLDLVLTRNYETNYMDGTTLLVIPGSSASDLILPANFYPGKSWLLPCQMQKPDIPLTSCPPLSQAQDEAGFKATWPGGEPVEFRGRYTYLTPFRFANRTYVALTSSAQATMPFWAILEPRPNRQFHQACLFTTIEENF